MIVVDASLLLELLLRFEGAAAAERRLFSPGETLHAPHLVDLEVAQVLRRYCLSQELTAGRAEEALDDFLQLPLQRYSHEWLLGRIWELRHQVSAYDAAYVALAETLGAPLATSDRKLAAVAGRRVAVELIR